MVALGVTALLITAVAVASAAPPSTGKNAITCFGDPASCTVVNKTSVRLDTTGTNGGAGVYIPGFNSSFYGVRTALVTNLSNTVTGSPLGIDPRWSIPIDNTTYNVDGDGDGLIGDGRTDYVLFVSFADCNNGAGLVDVLNDSTCTINRSDSPTTYPNWSTFVTVETNTNISSLDLFAFIIADESGPEGVWTISNMKVGKPGK
jgi:hypothetical protein